MATDLKTPRLLGGLLAKFGKAVAAGRGEGRVTLRSDPAMAAERVGSVPGDCVAANAGPDMMSAASTIAAVVKLLKDICLSVSVGERMPAP